jgi:hypothetical protein
MARSTTSFRKGRSGNPNGAPKREWSWSGILQDTLEKKAKNGGDIKELVAISLVRQALKGNVVAIKELMNRMDGMPKQITDIRSDGEQAGVMIYRPKRLDE